MGDLPPVVLDVLLLFTSEGAYKVSALSWAGDRFEWLPRTQVELRPTRRQYLGRPVYEVEIPGWLAQRRGITGRSR